MKIVNLIFYVVTSVIGVNSWASANVCSRPTLNKEIYFPDNAKWRSGITNTTSDISDLTKKAEKSFSKMVQERKVGTLEEGWAAEMTPEFITTAELIPLVDAGAYGSHIRAKWGIKNSENTLNLRLVLLLTVSGHVGSENALKWAKSDKYRIDAFYPSSGKRVTLVDQAPSKDVVTIQELDLVLVKGEVVRLRYERYGSAGAEAYPEQRTFELELVDP